MSISVAGELDLATAPQLEEALARALAAEATRIVVDLRLLTFMDSTGLGLFVTYHQRAREADKRLILVKGPPQAQRAFEVTGLTARLTIVDEPPPDEDDEEPA